MPAGIGGVVNRRSEHQRCCCIVLFRGCRTGVTEEAADTHHVLLAGQQSVVCTVSELLFAE
jgi:hypothetical protein